jgi:D-3-phosphoglycerate dehydrogenase / 2-oxoglutarate reductase
MKKLLVITPIEGIDGVRDTLEQLSDTEIVYIPDPTIADIMNHADTTYIFTNPNRLQVYLGEELLSGLTNIKAIATASTGTVHIDKDYCSRSNITILSLTTEYSEINKITGTAEHALCLTLMAVRKSYQAAESAAKGSWDCEEFIGRQFNKLTVGIIGYGRLGSLYANYCDSLGARVLVYDPYKWISHPRMIQVKSLGELGQSCDVLSLHVHVTEETCCMINEDFLKNADKLIAIVNTSRGEVVNEEDIVNELKRNGSLTYATDVLAEESLGHQRNRIAKIFRDGLNNIIVTPHIGGMTKEGREIAYGHAARMLVEYAKRDG